MEYVQFIHNDLQIKILEAKDRTEKKKLLERVARVFSVIHDEKINTKHDLEHNTIMMLVISSIKNKYLARVDRAGTHPITQNLRNVAVERDGFDKF